MLSASHTALNIGMPLLRFTLFTLVCTHTHTLAIVCQSVSAGETNAAREQTAQSVRISLCKRTGAAPYGVAREPNAFRGHTVFSSISVTFSCGSSSSGRADVKKDEILTKRKSTHARTHANTTRRMHRFIHNVAGQLSDRGQVIEV